MSKKNKKSHSWFSRHSSDSYVKLSKIHGYRSRACYKLIELQKKYKLFLPGMSVFDLGSSPGSWSQVITHYVGSKGKIFALDVLEMSPLPSVKFIKGDFNSPGVYNDVLASIGKGTIDFVVSDMSPNISGNKIIDQQNSINLVKLSFRFSNKVLKKNGSFLFKIFWSNDANNFINSIRELYKKVIINKPCSSRSSSSEVYVIAFFKK